MTDTKNYVAVILARGGSKEIPSKNITEFCNKPLIYWTINQCLKAEGVKEVWVSSDSDEILKISESYGAKSIKRPKELSKDESSSESAWLHAIKFIEDNFYSIDLVIAPQVTSPLRESEDLERGIIDFEKGNFDSMFSGSLIKDFFFWEKNEKSDLESINYDHMHRKRRQDINEKYIENGSFYLFKPETLRTYNNRFGESVGLTLMESWKTYEIDSSLDLRVCSSLMQEFLIKE